MGTEKHSKASKKRWAKVPAPDKSKKMSAVAQSGWDKLDTKARRRRALKGVRTRKAHKLEVSQISGKGFFNK